MKNQVFSSGLKKTNRKIKKFEKANYKEQFMKTHKIWRKVEYWTALKNTAPNWSYAKYLKGIRFKI
jgi:putative spermidine/putrescine transport system permease protein